jgi:glycosyltransferase involved in cell wall biosynthesis
MTDFEQFRRRFSELKTCIILPTYNNDQTLEQVVRQTLEYSGDVIVVNDGSTDNTAEILKKFKTITAINLHKNRGKGYALRLGFHHALRQGFRYAITLDSDGQHFPDDLPKFLDKIEKEPDSVIIGARDMNHESVPGTSNFGHKFSIFWFKIETGQKVPDIQSGYRLYPLEKIDHMRVFGRKYEFEVEVLVKLAWKDVPITSVPIKVYYAPKNERVSHFRKFHDFSRVSITNAILVFMAFFWINPFRFIKALRKTTVKKFFQEYVINSGDSNLKIAASVTLGVFAGIMPVWGFQMLIAFWAAHFLKLNRFVTVVASNISIPPMLPLIIYLSYVTGELIVGLSSRGAHLHYSSGMALQWFKANLLQYLVGSIVFGILAAIVFGLITYVLLKLIRNPKNTGSGIDLKKP